MRLNSGLVKGPSGGKHDPESRVLRLPGHWLPVYLTVLFIGSVMPVGSGAQDVLMNNFTLSIRWDYLVHVVIYLPLPGLLFLALRPAGFFRVFGVVLLILIIPALFEFIQMSLPYRTFNINDLLANEIGVVLGLGFWVLGFRIRGLKAEVD